MASENEKIKRRYNRLSKVYDLFENPMESMTTDSWRNKMMESIEGKLVLEVGVGTGKNLAYYPEKLTVVGIDFSEKMLEKAKSKIEEKENITLIEMDAQEMTFPDDTFDTVVCSCVFCSVPDPVTGLKEMRRVCKPGGKIIMLEHMRSNHKFLGKAMDAANVLTVTIWGANINRRTMDNLEKADFKEQDIQSQNVWKDIVKFIEITNNK